jgi:hypothetical protein
MKRHATIRNTWVALAHQTWLFCTYPRGGVGSIHELLSRGFLGDLAAGVWGSRKPKAKSTLPQPHALYLVSKRIAPLLRERHRQREYEDLAVGQQCLF